MLKQGSWLLLLTSFSLFSWYSGDLNQSLKGKFCWLQFCLIQVLVFYDWWLSTRLVNWKRKANFTLPLKLSVKAVSRGELGALADGSICCDNKIQLAGWADLKILRSGWIISVYYQLWNCNYASQSRLTIALLESDKMYVHESYVSATNCKNVPLCKQK